LNSKFFKSNENVIHLQDLFGPAIMGAEVQDEVKTTGIETIIQTDTIFDKVNME
jgi:hypothetical protein